MHDGIGRDIVSLETFRTPFHQTLTQILIDRGGFAFLLFDLPQFALALGWQFCQISIGADSVVFFDAEITFLNGLHGITLGLKFRQALLTGLFQSFFILLVVNFKSGNILHKHTCLNESGQEVIHRLAQPLLQIFFRFCTSVSILNLAELPAERLSNLGRCIYCSERNVDFYDIVRINGTQLRSEHLGHPSHQVATALE